MKFTACDRNSFEEKDFVIQKLEKEFGKAKSIMSCNVRVKSNSESELARDLASVNVSVYQIDKLFFIFQENCSLNELALMFKSALNSEEIEELEVIKAKATHDYKEAIEFLAKNTF